MDAGGLRWRRDEGEPRVNIGERQRILLHGEHRHAMRRERREAHDRLRGAHRVGERSAAGNDGEGMRKAPQSGDPRAEQRRTPQTAADLGDEMRRGAVSF